MDILPVILSGGSGTRLWPVSRAAYPKQLQKLCGDKTLLQQTAIRLTAGKYADAIEILPPVVVCNADHLALIKDQLREIDVAPSRIMLEPVGRGTAAALAVAALDIANPRDTVMVAMPADHFIPDNAAFMSAVITASRLADDGRLMTLGITPSSAHTGYGYMEPGEKIPGSDSARIIAAFHEKPDPATAESYLKNGRHLWNAGVFIFRADCYLEALERLEPLIVDSCREAIARGARRDGVLRLARESFAACPALSVDRAVLERDVASGVLPVSFGWSDIGNWAELWRLGPRDASGNVLAGAVAARDARDCYVRAGDKMVALLGADNLIVVDTPDALLVAGMASAESVKSIIPVATAPASKRMRSGQRPARAEKRILQSAIALGGCVPVLAGMAGLLQGPLMAGGTAHMPVSLDSHFRYLSGLLLALGIGFWTTIPRIENNASRFLLLTAIVLTGGLGRLWSLLAIGRPSPAMISALVMELGITPLLALWQYRLAQASNVPPVPGDIA